MERVKMRGKERQSAIDGVMERVREKADVTGLGKNPG